MEFVAAILAFLSAYWPFLVPAAMLGLLAGWLRERAQQEANHG